jgi:hypothetical protein
MWTCPRQRGSVSGRCRVEDAPRARYRDLDTTDLRCPQSCAIGNAQSRTISEPRAWGRCQHLRDLFDTQNTRQPAWLRPELHVALHVLTVAGRAEQKPQGHDPRVERWWRDLGIGHVKLIGAQIVRRRCIWRPLQKPATCLIARMWAFCALSPIPWIRMSSAARQGIAQQCPERDHPLT